MAEEKPAAVANVWKTDANEPDLYNVHADPQHDGLINASGHHQEVERNFSFYSIAILGLTNSTTWPAFAGSVVVSLYNGGPPGVIYEYIACSVFYWLIAAVIAELASAVPSSAGVYHWAGITGGRRYGLICSWMAGWFNMSAQILASSSISCITGNIIISLWALYHEDYVFQRWHVFITYILTTWIAAVPVLFFNRAIPTLASVLGTTFILVGGLITVIVLAILPGKTGNGYASSAQVWRVWDNQTGWPSGFAFMLGMLNGAYSLGMPDALSHLAEELPKPRTNMPKAIGMMMGTGFLTGLIYMIALFYAVSDVRAATDTGLNFPIVNFYLQATGTRAGATGLTLLLLFPLLSCLMCVYVTASRVVWTLARDNATPFSKFLSKVDERNKYPFNAAAAMVILTTCFGAIYAGSAVAFNAFVGSFVVLLLTSYLPAILPNLLTNRRHVPPGPFSMGRWTATVVYGISCAFILATDVIFCFPFSAPPVEAKTMNYTSAISGGFAVFFMVFYFFQRSRGYVGPQALLDEGMRFEVLTAAKVEEQVY